MFLIRVLERRRGLQVEKGVRPSSRRISLPQWRYPRDIPVLQVVLALARTNPYLTSVDLLTIEDTIPNPV